MGSTKEGKGEMTEMKLTEPAKAMTPRVVVEDFDIATVAVRVVDFDVPFGSLVGFFLKCVFAAIPAMIIIGMVTFVLMLFMAALSLPTR